MYCVLDGVFGHILQSLYWMTLKSVAISKAETAAGHIMKLLSLTFGKKFRTACHDVANIFRWQMLKATSTIDLFCPVMRSYSSFFIIELFLCDEVLTIDFVPINLQKFGREGIEGRELKF